MKKKLEYTSILSWAKKIKAIHQLGGKCRNCGDDNIFHLTFHHLDLNEKEFEISDIRKYRWSKIDNELRKCELLCYNCHSEIHKIETIDTRFNDNKKIFLEFKKLNSCEKCGYDKYNGSLHFHHKENKLFPLNRIFVRFENVHDLTEKIEIELNKCLVLCANCHYEYHHKTEFFVLNEIEIYEKSKNIKEKMLKIDRNLIKKMYFEDGKRQIDIVNFFGCKKSTISEIIKKMKEY